MKTKPIDHHRVAFVQGQLAQSTLTPGNSLENPYILTSNCSDAFLLGALAATSGIPTNADLHKSRGYTWRMNGRMYLVEGKEVKAL